MRSLRSRFERVRSLLGKGDIIETSAQRSDSAAASTSGRSYEEACRKAERLHTNDLPNRRFPWNLVAGTGVSLGIGYTFGQYGNQMRLPDMHLPQLSWNSLPNPITGTSEWFSRQNSGIWGHNFLADAAAKAMPAVVNIRPDVDSEREVDECEKSSGSGFLVDKSGIILTNAHVVDSALQNSKQNSKAPKALRVMLEDGRAFAGRVLSLDRVSDLAMVKIDSESPFPTVKLGCSQSMRAGEWVLALGSPLTLQNSVTAGIISCTGRKATELGFAGRAMQYIQTDAAINTGNSGGPLVNLAGEVVGISCMKALFSTGVSFAIPIDYVQDIIEQMKAKGQVVRPYIGIKMLQLTSENVAQMQKKDSHFPALTTGILVATVHPGSPAAKAGLLQGDIIKDFGSRNTEGSIAGLVEALREKVGGNLNIKVQRGNESCSLTVSVLEDRTSLFEP